MSHSLNSLNGFYIKGTVIGVIKGDTRSLDYSSSEGFNRISGLRADDQQKSCKALET